MRKVMIKIMCDMINGSPNYPSYRGSKGLTVDGGKYSSSLLVYLL